LRYMRGENVSRVRVHDVPKPLPLVMNIHFHFIRRSIRAPALLLEHCRKRAFEEGWQFSELA
jgi:hypothetical protein